MGSGYRTATGRYPQPDVRSHNHVGGVGVLGAHPGSGYKMQLLHRVLRVKLNNPNRRYLKSYLRGLGNLLLDSGMLGLKSAQRIKKGDKFIISCRHVL